MKATESLELEHRKIARVAEACEVFADELRQGSKIPARVLHSLADFFRLYGEQYHHQEKRSGCSACSDKKGCRQTLGHWQGCRVKTTS